MRPATLVDILGAALEWPKATRRKIGLENAYPSVALLKGLDQRVGQDHPGSQEASPQNLMAWEDQYAVCENPNPDPGRSGRSA